MCKDCARYIEGMDNKKACGINLKYLSECKGKFFVKR